MGNEVSRGNVIKYTPEEETSTFGNGIKEKIYASINKIVLEFLPNYQDYISDIEKDETITIVEILNKSNKIFELTHDIIAKFPNIVKLHIHGDILLEDEIFVFGITSVIITNNNLLETYNKIFGQNQVDFLKVNSDLNEVPKQLVKRYQKLRLTGNQIYDMGIDLEETKLPKCMRMSWKLSLDQLEMEHVINKHVEIDDLSEGSDCFSIAEEEELDQLVNIKNQRTGILEFDALDHFPVVTMGINNKIIKLIIRIRTPNKLRLKKDIWTKYPKIEKLVLVGRIELEQGLLSEKDQDTIIEFWDNSLLENKQIISIEDNTVLIKSNFDTIHV